GFCKYFVFGEEWRDGAMAQWRDQCRLSASVGLDKTPCGNCNHKHRCAWETGRASCQRCGSLNIACKPIPSNLFDSIKPQPNSRDMTGTAPSPSISTGLSRDRFTEKPLIHEESFKKPSLPLGSEYRGSLVGSSSVGKRGAGSKACIPTSDARL
ncbi:hypothetical protein MJO28_013004, partial [Puccinia striiformis f. sp. tritici]